MGAGGDTTLVAAIAAKAGTTRSRGQIRNMPNSGHIDDLNSGLGQARAYAGMALVNAGDFWEPGWS